MNLLLIRGSASHLPLADESVQTCVTSPPYWGLRQYAGEQREVWGGDPEHPHEWAEVLGGEGYAAGQKRKWQHGATRGDEPDGWAGETVQGGFCCCGAWYGALGLEPTPELYVQHMVAIFGEVRRVLRKDGTLWLNLGDSYAGSWGAQGRSGEMSGRSVVSARQIAEHPQFGGRTGSRGVGGDIKPKDLVGIPWMVAFALRADGWYLRSDIIWHKPNPMPESVTDRPTKSHEYLFLLTKSEQYFYDAEAIREPLSTKTVVTYPTPDKAATVGQTTNGTGASTLRLQPRTGRNKRTVWTIPTRPYPGAHFATYPEQLVEPCIIAGTSPKACGVCGAPWERVTEREGGKSVAGPKSTEKREQGLATAFSGYDDGSTAPTFVTLGWRSTCEHEDDSGSCVVLDPFNGSGTTGRVAVRHGRSYVGVDIAHEYLVEQSKARIDNIQHTLGLEAAL